MEISACPPSAQRATLLPASTTATFSSGRGDSKRFSPLADFERGLKERMASPTLAHSAFDFIIDDILPAREVHLIGGPSGSGKTTWVFQILLPSIQIGAEVFGRQAHPTSICYVACDRSDASLRRTLKRLKMSNEIPAFSITHNKAIRTLNAVITEARRKIPGVKLLIIDALAVLVPEGRINDYKTVSDFLTDSSYLCEHHDITIIGLLHSPKTREGEEYSNPRQRIMGTVAWGGFADTVVMIEPCKENGSERMVTLCSRNNGDEEHFYRFNDEGLLEVINAPDDQTADIFDLHILPILKPDTEYRRTEFLELAGQLGIKCSLATVKRWLQGKVKAKVFEQPDRGLYRLMSKSGSEGREPV